MREPESSVLRDFLKEPDFCTDDLELDRLLEAARAKFSDSNPEIRAEALEKLWDAWERLKTIHSDDKKVGIRLLLEEAIPDQTLRARVEEEATALTRIGNEFMIRHTETNKIKLTRTAEVDYLFHRLFALVWLLLTPTRDKRMSRLDEDGAAV